MDNRDELADFLKRRRDSLQPAEVGLSPGARRRTHGLRREEVAALAYMSTDFYARLEQSRGSRPSEQTTASLARALRLTPDERDHLFTLAGYNPPPRGYRTDIPSPALLRILEMLDTPAQIVSDIGVTLKQNALAEALIGVHSRYTGLRRSMIYRWFTDPQARALHPPDEHHLHSHSHVAWIRTVYTRDGDDPEVRELVEHLLAESSEFAELWEAHEVSRWAHQIKRFVHPVVGTITLHCEILTAQNITERLIVFTAMPGSEDVERLALLRVIGAQSFAA
jgi:transcriptional regulator with XRE-family HTH domain